MRLTRHQGPRPAGGEASPATGGHGHQRPRAHRRRALRPRARASAVPRPARRRRRCQLGPRAASKRCLGSCDWSTRRVSTPAPRRRCSRWATPGDVASVGRGRHARRRRRCRGRPSDRTGEHRCRPVAPASTWAPHWTGSRSPAPPPNPTFAIPPTRRHPGRRWAPSSPPRIGRRRGATPSRGRSRRPATPSRSCSRPTCRRQWTSVPRQCRGDRAAVFNAEVGRGPRR